MKEERDVFGDEDVTGREGEEDVIEAFDEMPPTGLAVGERSKNSNNDAFAMLPFGEYRRPQIRRCGRPPFWTHSPNGLW